MPLKGCNSSHYFKAIFMSLTGIVKGGWFDIHFISDTNINSAGFYATFQVYNGAGTIPTASAGSFDRGNLLLPSSYLSI